MNKNAKIAIITILFCIICLLIGSCSGKIIPFILGEDGKCDYCGEKAGIEKGTKEWCAECFIEQGEKFY